MAGLAQWRWLLRASATSSTVCLVCCTAS
jgi:hypothetical protein